MTDFNFSPSQVATEVEKKLAIKRLPAWMQESEQIQKYFDDVIQHWFTPEQQRSIDGYIGLRGGVNSDDKVYVEEINKERQEYQLAPTMVSTGATNNVLAALTYPDLIGNLQFQGALTDNASRLLNGRLYSWAPPINPDMIVNYSNYYWDTTNADSVKRPDYIVMQRDARDGNLWSKQNHWYPIQYKSANGATVTITNEDITSGRFVQAQRPIIEFVRDIELLDFGRNARGTVDLVCETLIPEDIMFRSFSDSIKVDGVYLQKNHRVLFTSISNPGENNRIYKVTQELKNGKQVYGLILDSDEITAERPSGEPFINDTIHVINGTKYLNNVLFWTGRTWKVGQQKTKNNQFPLFVLYDKNGKRLDNQEQYPASTFKGSNIFSIKIDSKYPIDGVYGMSVAVDKNGDNVYNNNLNSDKFTYVNEGKTVEISKFRFYNVTNKDPLKDQFFSEWREVLIPSRQYCRQLINVIVDKSGVVKKYKMALVPEKQTSQYTNIKVDVNGDYITSNDYAIENGMITIKVALKENDMITILSYNGTATPDFDLGVYEIPMNLKNNAANENIDYIEESKLVDHFMDIITNQVGFVGSANGTNNYNDTAREIDVGRKIAQHDASLIPLMVHNTSKNIDIINAIEYSKNAYTRFKNKFVNKLSEAYTTTMESNTDIRSIVVKLLNEINVGRTSEFPFWLTGVGRTDALPQTFIPATPQYLGIVPITKPRVRVKADIGFGTRLYNVSHTGTYSTCFSTMSMVDGSIVVVSDYRDDVIFQMETMIFQSAHPQFIDEDYMPMLHVMDVRPSLLRVATEYTANEWDKIALRGFSSWATTNHVDYKTNSGFELGNWKTWNYSSTMYRVNNQSARGNWKAIHMDHFDTTELNTAPWQCFGFSIQPTWWDREYTKVVFLNTDQRAYVDPKLWADIEAGIIRDGDRKGTWPKYARTNFTKYNPIQADGTMVAPHQAVAGRLSLVTKAPAASDAASDWKFGDLGDIEFMYMNTAYYAFDTAASLYRAKPAQWSNYFWNATAYKKYTQGKYTQWLNASTDDRLAFNEKTIVHGEDDTRIIGYSMWISDFLKYNHLDITRNYGDIVRGAGVKLSYRIGGFTQNQNMTFVSDSFGLVSQENQHLRLLKSAVKRQEVFSGLKIVFDRGRYRISGYDTSYPYLSYFKPLTSSDKHYVKLENRAFIKYLHWDETPVEIKYDTSFNSIQDVYTFISGYGEYLESKGWIFEDITDEGEVFDWHMMAFKFADWAMGARNSGDFVSLSPCTRSVKFVSEHGNIENVTQFSGGSWSLVDDQYRGIGEHEIETARIGNFIVVRMNEESEKRIMMVRVNTSEYEHMVIFDNTTIFNDVIYLPIYGLHQLRLKVYGTITDSWNGRLEAPGFMVVDNSTLPNFEKLVEDFSHYYDSENPSTSVELNNLARHFIGFQSREYLRRLILNERNQLDFYKGYIKEKGTMQVFDKVLRTSKSIRSTNYKVLEEWAFKVGEFGALNNDQRLEFKILEQELKQEPQMFRFNEAQTVDDKFDATVTYFGTQGNDDRWITRNVTNQFPTIKSTEVKAFMPDCGPFNKNDMDFIAQDIVDFTSRRIEKQTATGKMPHTALIVDQDGTWDYVDIIESDGIAMYSVVVPEINGSQIFFDREVTLQDGDRFFIDSPTIMVPSAVRTVNYYYSNEFTNKTVINLPIPQDMSSIDMSQVKLYFIQSRYGREADRIALIKERTVDIVDINAFSKPVIYNANSNQTDTYLALFDPRQGVIPGAADSEVSYKTMFDPALYNFIEEGAAAWGAEKVGYLWWDTSKATYVDYHQPIRTSAGVVDIEATRQYRRDSWGTLLPGGEIVLYEWVRSPVHPSEWDEYSRKQSILNKTVVGWVPTGTAVEERWSEKFEYDAMSASVKKYYYFWVRDAYSIPNVPFRKMPASEIKRIIENPQNSGQPWFAPISSTEFIIGGINGLISSEDSVLQLRYKAEHNNNNNVHKEWKLFKEGEDYNFDEEIWTNMCNSLVGERVINNEGDTAVHEYPLVDVGNAENKTWFRDVLMARREFAAQANEIFQNVNILANSNIVQTVLNYTEKNTNPYFRNFVVTQYNGELVLRVSKPGIFSNGDAVMIKTTSELPSPLLETSVYFIERVPEKNDLFILKAVPSAVTPITIVNKGIGAHTIVRVDDLNKTDGTELDMTRYWTTIDWYAPGYNSNTPFIEVSSLSEAETMSLSPTDVVRVVESSNIWALYIRDHSRNVPIWKTVGRKDSTIALNSNIFNFDRIIDGKYTAQELLIRRALRKIFTMFESVQSRMVFGMVYHVVAEQKVVDWVFKTSYIHIIGIDKALASKTVSLSDPLADVMDYFNEVKPYRTKIRAAMDQRTSDDDAILASMRDTDPDPAEHQKYLDEMAKPEAERDLSKIKARFRESGTMLFFDNTQLQPNTDLKPAWYYEKEISDYLRQFDTETRLPEEVVVSGCPNTAYNGTYIEIFDTREIPVFDKGFAVNLGIPFIDRTRRIYVKRAGVQSYYIWNQIGIGWIISGTTSTLDWYYEVVNSGADLTPTAYAVRAWRNAEKKTLAARSVLSTSIAIKLAVESRDDVSKSHVLERLMRDPTVIQTKIAAKLRTALNSRVAINDAQWKSFVVRLARTTMDGTMYYDVPEFIKICKELSITSEVEMQRILQEASEPMRDIVTYYTLANRLRMYNTDAPQDYLDTVINGGFKGRQISNNPNTRIPFGYSASSDAAQDGYYVWSSEIYNKIKSEMIDDGMFELDVLKKMVEYGYGSLVPYVPQLGFDADDGSVTKSIHISDPHGLNDMKISNSPLQSEELQLSNGYVDDLGAYDNLGYEKQSVAVKFDNVVDGQYLFDVHELKLIDSERSKFAVTIGKYQPEKTQDVDYGVIIPGGKIQAGTTKGRLDVDYKAFNNASTSLYTWDYGSQYGQTYSTTNGSFSVEGVCIRDPKDAHRIVVSAPRTIKPYSTEWLKENPTYPAAERHLYPFGIQFMPKDVTDTITEFRIGAHTLRDGDQVILLTNDSADIIPVGASFDDVNTRYFVKVVNKNTVSLYTKSGTKTTPVVLNVSVLETDELPVMKLFSMFLVNPLKAKNTVIVDVFNYDAYYNRFLHGGDMLPTMKKINNNTIMSEHKFKTGDKVIFTNIGETDDIGDIKNGIEYYVNVLNATSFQIMSTVEKAIAGVDALRVGVDVSNATISCVNFWLSSTVSSVRYDSLWHYNYDLLSPEAKIAAMKREIGTDENTTGTIVVDHGFARPLIDKGSLREKVRMHLQEHVSFTVFQDDRAVAASSKVYDANNVHMYNTYSSGAAPFAFKIEKGHSATAWEVTRVADTDVRTLAKPLWYTDDEIHIYGTLPAQGYVQIEGEYIKYKVSTTYTLNGKLTTKVSKLSRGVNYTHENNMYQVETKVLVALDSSNEVNVMLNRNKSINTTLPKADYSYSTQILFETSQTGPEMFFTSLKGATGTIGSQLNAHKATYKGLN